MKKLSIPILIANWRGGEAIELCIESILKRTGKGMSYKIHVFDSTGRTSRERAYLLKQEEAGRILLTTSEKRHAYGEAMMILIGKCRKEWACIVDSDTEILSGDWLKFMFDQIKTSKDLIIGSIKGVHFLPVPPSERPIGSKKWDLWGPRILPFCMLLNLSLYKKIGTLNDWASMVFPIKEGELPEEYNSFFEIREKFPGINLPRKKDITKVIYDICGKFLFIARAHGFESRRIPGHVLAMKIKHYEQMSHLKHAKKDRKELKKNQVHDALINLRKEVNKDMLKKGKARSRRTWPGAVPPDR